MASKLSGDVGKIFDSIEDIVAQADEVDEKYLQVSESYVHVNTIQKHYLMTNNWIMTILKSYLGDIDNTLLHNM